MASRSVIEAPATDAVRSRSYTYPAHTIITPSPHHYYTDAVRSRSYT